MSSLHAIQMLTTAARLSREEFESVPKAEITKKLDEIKYLSSQKKILRLSLRKEIIHLENELQGVLELEERFARHKDKESITVASLKQQISALKNKLKAGEYFDLDHKVEHLSFLLGEHLAKREVANEVEMMETVPAKKLPVTAQPQEAATEKSEDEKTGERCQAIMNAAKKATMLQRRLDALKQELDLHRELETKNPQEMQMIEEKIKSFEDRLQQYYEQHPEARLQEGSSVEIPVDFEVKHKLLFPQSVKTEEEDVMEGEKMLPLPPPPSMRKKKE